VPGVDVYAVEPGVPYPRGGAPEGAYDLTDLLVGRLTWSAVKLRIGYDRRGQRRHVWDAALAACVLSSAKIRAPSAWIDAVKSLSSGMCASLESSTIPRM